MNNTDMISRIGRIISEYDAQGWHRTGTVVDDLSAEWLAGEFRAAGVEPALERYPLSRIDVRAAYLDAAGRRFEGLPLFDCTYTGPEGLEGKAGVEGGVLLLNATPGGEAHELEAARADGKYAAIVLGTNGGVPGLAPRNAWAFARPFGPPVLQIPRADFPALAGIAGSPVRVVAHVVRTGVTAANVWGEIPGTDPSLAPVVVMTPRSGWFHCASERGGGLCCLLEVARAVSAARPARTVIFTATTGHELDYWGLAQFMAARPSLGKGAHIWVHFGASVGAAIEPRANLFFSDDTGQALVEREFAEEGITGVNITPRGTRPPGEARDVHIAGGRYTSQAGGSALFHLEADRWPTAVDTESIARFASAYSRTVLALAQP